MHQRLILQQKLTPPVVKIWTDTPGVYTANPRIIPQARILNTLDYDEAQEIAAMGGKILHPNCVAPLKAQQIPLYIKFTEDPKRAGTRVCFGGQQSGLPIKSILTKNNLLLIHIETINMWQQVGFLAEVFATFKQHQFSIDLVSTSESSVTVSLDSSANLKDNRALELLLADLNKNCKRHFDTAMCLCQFSWTQHSRGNAPINTNFGSVCRTKNLYAFTCK